MGLNHRKLSPTSIDLVDSSENFVDGREPPLMIGHFVRLNSGGPIMIVVEHSKTIVTVAYRDRVGAVLERNFPTACVHRALIA
jgi:uncharacterized protein YodC (DUF2158 family)